MSASDRRGLWPKFRVRHHHRGDLGADEAFVLVPGRDPAAVIALKAYADATPDPALAADLRRWVAAIEGSDPATIAPSPAIVHRIAVWTAVLAREVREGGMDIETALQRIAGHAAVAAKEAS